MNLPENTPVRFPGATGFVEYKLPTTQAIESDTLVPLVISGAQHDELATAKIDSGNFVFTDVNGNEIPSDLASFSTGNNFQCWVRFPNVSTVTDQYVYLQYGEGIIRSNDTATWTGAGYSGVWSLDGGTADRTGTNSLTAVGNLPNTEPGQVGSGQQFDGSSHYTLNDYDYVTTGGFRVSFWVRKNSPLKTFPHICQLKSSITTSPFIVYLEDTNSGYNYLGWGTIDSTIQRRRVDQNLFGTLRKVSINIDSSANSYAQSVYVDGNEISTVTNSGFGNRTNANRLGGTTAGTQFQYSFDGLIDHFTVESNQIRSAEWELREYNNQSTISTDGMFTVSRTITFNDAPIATPGRYAGADGFIEITLPKEYAYQNDTYVPLVISGARLDSEATSNLTSTNFIFTDIDGNEIPSELASFTSGNDFQAWVQFSTNTAEDSKIYLQYGDEITRGNSTSLWTNAGYDRVYHLEENSGTTLFDSSGNANATTVNSPTLGATGQLGGAIDLEKDAKQYASATSPGGTQYSVSTWVNFETLAAFPGVLHWYSANGRRTGIIYNTSGNKWQIDYEIANTQLAFSQSPAWTPVFGTWYHVFATYDGESPALYINGSSVSLLYVSAGNFNAGVNAFQFGRQNIVGGDNYTFDGLFDEVRHAPAAKSASWVLREYNNQASYSQDALFTFSTTGEFSSNIIINSLTQKQGVAK